MNYGGYSTCKRQLMLPFTTAYGSSHSIDAALLDADNALAKVLKDIYGE